jgi:hypothetical protein
MARPALEQQAQHALHLQGYPCAQVSIGTGDTLIVDFGALHPIHEDELSGELALIIDCPWRLDDADEPLCGWHDDEDHIIHQVAHLIGARVESVELRRPGFDLILRFIEGHTLRLFPDIRAYYHDELAGESVPWYVIGAALPVEDGPVLPPA